MAAKYPGVYIGHEVERVRILRRPKLLVIWDAARSFGMYKPLKVPAESLGVKSETPDPLRLADRDHWRMITALLSKASKYHRRFLMEDKDECWDSPHILVTPTATRQLQLCAKWSLLGRLPVLESGGPITGCEDELDDLTAGHMTSHMHKSDVQNRNRMTIELAFGPTSSPSTLISIHRSRVSMMATIFRGPHGSVYEYSVILE
ncbi:uncharacterized protein B0H18DRAFT_958724 [Fomitopsis serialis]|uniref:uncharacterized protein n=1 Tax=Fomitopsis serialis TaxID=139415 RepID=UPI0020073E28|nr:uncharacterized protein B0H18DRAFT_958724 [Neoantrodia serialis]KAH9916709.1 hypothetical protein B0H18DRAFT_958724 [Neoantrodia serialis]